MTLWQTLRPITRLAGTFDEGFLSLTLKRSHEPPKTIPGDARARLETLSAFYKDLGEGFFPTPKEISPTQRWVRSLEGGSVVDLSWESGYTPRLPEVKEQYLRDEANQTAHARLFRHDTPRPAILCIHGYGGGRYAIEELAFSAKWLYSLGLDVVLPSLPFHGLRRVGGGWPSFPNASRVGMTNEGFGQAVYDLRALIAWLRESRADVAITGMSLGGYTTSLMATVEPGLALAAPMIPFASYADLVWEHGEGLPAQARALASGIDHAALSEAFAIHSPLRRRPLLTGERVLVSAGEADRVTPKAHALQLQAHFQTEHVVIFPGGHLLQLGRKQFFGALAKRLAALGLIEKRR